MEKQFTWIKNKYQQKKITKEKIITITKHTLVVKFIALLFKIVALNKIRKL